MLFPMCAKIHYRPRCIPPTWSSNYSILNNCKVKHKVNTKALAVRGGQQCTYVPNKTKNACQRRIVSATISSMGPTVHATFIDVDRALHTLANWLSSYHYKRYTPLNYIPASTSSQQWHNTLHRGAKKPHHFIFAITFLNTDLFR